MDKTTPPAATPPEPKKQRSPAYPSLGLGDAIAKVKALYKADGNAVTSFPVMAGHWDTTPKSSSFLQWVGTLKQFGLIEEIEGPGDRRFKLTRRALDIVMLDDDTNAMKIKAIKAAALAPKIHAELWKDHGNKLPSDSNLTHYLVTSKGFQEAAAKDLIKCYKKTLAVANLSEGDKIPTANQTVEVGDLVQWESLGIAQFPEPRAITGKSADGLYVFVDGTQTGLPIDQVRKVEPTNGKTMTSPATPQAPPPTPSAGLPPLNPNYKPIAPTKQYVLTVDTGDVVVRWPETLSDEDYETIEGWLEGLKRKIKRSVKGAEDEQN